MGDIIDRRDSGKSLNMGTEDLIQYSELAWPAVTTALRSKILMLPTGAIEQHGPRLP